MARATTTPKVRAAIQASDEPASSLAERFGTTEQTVYKLNRPGFTGGQNSRRIARYGTDTKEEDIEAVFT